MIGDPSGKSDERNLLDEATLNHNVEGIKGVLSRFLDFNSEEVNAPVLVKLRLDERVVFHQLCS
jgi:tyrosyl-tRNA synthetase